MYVCASTIRATGLKFGTELGFYPEMVLVSASRGPCSPHGAYPGKQKLQGAPN